MPFLCRMGKHKWSEPKSYPSNSDAINHEKRCLRCGKIEKRREELFFIAKINKLKLFTIKPFKINDKTKHFLIVKDENFTNTTEKYKKLSKIDIESIKMELKGTRMLDVNDFIKLVKNSTIKLGVKFFEDVEENFGIIQYFFWEKINEPGLWLTFYTFTKVESEPPSIQKIKVESLD